MTFNDHPFGSIEHEKSVRALAAAARAAAIFARLFIEARCAARRKVAAARRAVLAELVNVVLPVV